MRFKPWQNDGREDWKVRENQTEAQVIVNWTEFVEGLGENDEHLHGLIRQELDKNNNNNSWRTRSDVNMQAPNGPNETIANPNDDDDNDDDDEAFLGALMENINTPTETENVNPGITLEWDRNHRFDPVVTYSDPDFVENMRKQR